MEYLLIILYVVLFHIVLISLMLAHFIFLARLVNRFGKGKLWIKILVLDFVIIDYIGNWFFSGMFLDFPKKGELITGRLKRYKDAYDVIDLATYKKIRLTPIEQWRLWWAVNICNILSRADEGHC